MDFSSLPPELRSQIYIFACATDWLPFGSCTDELPAVRRTVASLLQISRQIRDEVAVKYFNNHKYTKKGVQLLAIQAKHTIPHLKTIPLFNCEDVAISIPSGFFDPPSEDSDDISSSNSIFGTLLEALRSSQKLTDLHLRIAEDEFSFEVAVNHMKSKGLEELKCQVKITNVSSKEIRWYEKESFDTDSPPAPIHTFRNDIPKKTREGPRSPEVSLYVIARYTKSESANNQLTGGKLQRRIVDALDRGDQMGYCSHIDYRCRTRSVWTPWILNDNDNNNTDQFSVAYTGELCFFAVQDWDARSVSDWERERGIWIWCNGKIEEMSFERVV